jgi:hypothetical protein
MVHLPFIARRACGRTAQAGFRRGRVVGLAFLLLLATGSLGARQVSEYDVKAAFLLNFAKFVEWPPRAFASTNAPVVLGIVGKDPFGAALQILQGQTAQGRRIEVRHFAADAGLQDCHLVFLTRSVAGQMDDILRRVHGRPVLTVSDLEDFARQGGMIGFVLVDRTVRFDINPGAAKAVELKLSSRLLALARTLVKSP